MAEKQKIPAAFGAVLRAYRRERGLTQEQLSERVDVVHSFISGIELGTRQPNLQMILKLAAALGVSSGEIMNAVEDRLTDK